MLDPEKLMQYEPLCLLKEVMMTMSYENFKDLIILDLFFDTEERWNVDFECQNALRY